MSFEKVVEFSSGKNDWNNIEIGLHHEKIVVRDDHGRLELEEDALDQLINGLDQARRRLRENQRRPTQAAEE